MLVYDAVFCAGNNKCVIAKMKIRNAIAGGKIGRHEDIVIAVIGLAAQDGGAKGLFVKVARMSWNEEKTSGNVADDFV